MVLFLDYIVQWVKPDQEGGPFKFWICPATLTFKNCAEIELNLKWSYFHLDLQIEELIRRESRLTPNRIPETNWVLEFNEPSGYFSFWATDFELKILSPPILSETMTIR